MAGFSGSFALPGNLSLRFVAPSDETFLLELFIEARPWLSWAEGDRDFLCTLYEQQYKAMRAGQEAIYPEHIDLVIEKSADRVGRLVIDLGRADWRVSELQILARARGKGIGSDVLRGIQTAAATMLAPITLSTPIVGSHGRQVYERLGFRVTAIDPPHFHMAWAPPGHPMHAALSAIPAGAALLNQALAAPDSNAPPGAPA